MTEHSSEELSKDVKAVESLRHKVKSSRDAENEDDVDEASDSIKLAAAEDREEAKNEASNDAQTTSHKREIKFADNAESNDADSTKQAIKSEAKEDSENG